MVAGRRASRAEPPGEATTGPGHKLVEQQDADDIADEQREPERQARTSRSRAGSARTNRTGTPPGRACSRTIMFCFQAAGGERSLAAGNHCSNPVRAIAGVEFLGEERSPPRAACAARASRARPGDWPRCRSAGSPASHPARRGLAARTDSPGSPGPWPGRRRCAAPRRGKRLPGPA